MSITMRVDAAEKALQQMPRVSPRQAEQNSQYAVFRSLSKVAKTFKDLEREFWAYKLGITSQALQNQPAFFKWAKEIRLDKQLSHYDHRLQERGGAIEILQKGKFVPWQQNLVGATQQVPGFNQLYNPPLQYDQTGLVNRSYYDWTQPASYKREAPRAENIVELCVLADKQGKLRFAGDHSWIRIRDKKGGVYSFGLYREDNDFKTASVTKRGLVQSPDVSEFWPEEPVTLAVAVDDTKLQSILQHMGHKTPKNFQLQQENCTTFALDAMRMAGMELRAKTSVASNFIPGPLYWTGLKVKKVLPDGLRSIADKVWAVIRYPLDVLGGLFSVTLGAYRGTPPLIGSLFDIFKPSKQKMDAPHVLVWQTIPAVERARQAQGLGPYDIPPEFKA